MLLNWLEYNTGGCDEGKIIRNICLAIRVDTHCLKYTECVSGEVKFIGFSLFLDLRGRLLFRSASSVYAGS